MTFTGRTGTALLVVLIVSLCVNLLLAGMMLGGRWHDGPRRHCFLFGGPMMGSVPEEARPLMKEVFKSHKAEFDAHRRAIQQARMKVADLLKADTIDQAELDQALSESLRASQAMQQFGHQVMIEIAQKLPPEVRREMADRWAKDRFRKGPPSD
jgi:uncharacterized membrane protein